MMLISTLGRLSIFPGTDDANMTEVTFHLVKGEEGGALALRGQGVD
jgi:hypothetical protein